MKFFTVLWITAFMLLLELISGNMGLSPALPVFTAVYFAVAFAPEYGIASAGCAGILLDAACNRAFPFAAILFLAVTMLSTHIALRSSRHSSLSAVGIGGICGAMIYAGNLLYTVIGGTGFPGPDVFSMAVFQISGGALFLWLTVMLFDVIHHLCDLPCFVPSGKKSNLRGGNGR
jgi:hypothetical protein